MSDVDFGGSPAVPYFGEDGRAEATEKARKEEKEDRVDAGNATAEEAENATPEGDPINSGGVDPDGARPEEQENPSAGKDTNAEDAAEESEDGE